MSAAPAFDTLRFQQKLAEVLPVPTATAIAEAYGEATTSLASKSGLDLLESRLRAEIRGATADTIKWAIGSQVVLVTILFAAIRLL